MATLPPHPQYSWAHDLSKVNIVNLIILFAKSIINILDKIEVELASFRERGCVRMKIHWSEQALSEIQTRFGADAVTWKLVSDSEGCGCAMNGVATLWAISAPDKDDLQAESNRLAVWYEKRHEVFFDEQMRITYLPEHHAFQLASDGQIYSNRLRLVDKRTAEITN